MKVLMIHRDIGTGSVGKIVEDLYWGLKNNNHDCKIAYGYINKSRIPNNDLISVCDEITLKKHALFSRMTDRGGFFGKNQTKKLVEFIEQYRPDIIHIHGLYGYWIDINTLYSYLNKTNICVINTLHSCWDFTGHCCYFTKANCTKWKSHCYKCPEKNKYPKSIFIDNSYKNFENKRRLMCSLKNMFYVAPCDWMANCVKQSFLKEYKVHVINNGIDLSAFSRDLKNVTKYGINPEKKVILGVASVWEERKGIDDFIELAGITDHHYQIVLVGLSRQQISKLPKNIIGIQRTESREDLAAIYSASTVLFNPTYEDNYPTVNLEAIACGTPVVTYNTGGSPEIVEKLQAGKVIPFKDYSKLLEYVDYYSESSFDMDEMSRLYMSSDRMVKEYIDFYQLVI